MECEAVQSGTELSNVSVEPAFSIFLPLRWWQCIFFSNQCYLSTPLHGVISHQAELFTFNAAKTPSNLEKYVIFVQHILPYSEGREHQFQRIRSPSICPVNSLPYPATQPPENIIDTGY